MTPVRSDQKRDGEGDNLEKKKKNACQNNYKSCNN